MEMHIAAMMISCRPRNAVRAETLAGFADTDLGNEIHIVMDESRAEVPWRRTEDTFLRALERAANGDAPFSLILEDDVALNARVRHNLERWPPLLAAARPSAPFLGSLFHCGQPLLWQDDPRRARVAAPEGFWAAQALVISRATARHALRRWVLGVNPHDVQLPMLASELAPVYFHTPSLAQQRDVPSTWGAGVHRAPDYDPGFVAPDPAHLLMTELVQRSDHGSAHP
jgi:hypothetical protein